MKLKLTRYMGRKLASHLVVLFCLLLAVPWSRSAPVFDFVQKLTASDAIPFGTFGFSVGIDNGIAAAGAPDTTNGAVYTFALVGGTWVQTQKLTDPAPPGGQDAFGFALALRDGILVVGQPGNQNFFPTNNSSGQALIYRLVGGTWVLEQILTETNPAFPLGFGVAVAVSGDTVAVATQLEMTSSGFGSVSIYTNNGTSWNLQAKIIAPTGSSDQVFGHAIALDGNTLLVESSTQTSGTVDVFVRNGTTWSLQQTLTPPVQHPAEEFGAALALEGDTAVVGAPVDTTPGGFTNSAAFIFRRTGANFVLQQELKAPPTITEFNYAVAVAVHDGTVVVGDPERTVNGEIAAGGADIFQFNGTSWVLVQTITPPDAGTETNSPFGQFFGSALDIGPSGIIAGAHTDSGVAVGAGAAYIFSPSETNQLEIVNASASPNRLFPPNHKLVPVTISVTTQGNVASCKITRVSSNQPINGKGDGNTSPDWIITGDLTVLLRAERAGNIKTDRVYTITVQCTDTFGNTASTNVQVTVPHDNGK